MPEPKSVRRLARPRRRQGFDIEILEGRVLLTGSPDLSLVKTNLDSTFQQANTVIQNAIAMTTLPFVGGQIGSPINTQTNLQQTFENALAPITSQSPATAVQSALQNALGASATVSVLQKDVNGTDEFKVTQAVASTPNTTSPPLNFNLGLPGLKLTGSIGLSVNLGYTYSLDFGVNSGGFFISTDSTKTSFQFTPSVAVTPASFLTGTFGPLALTATDYTGDPDHLNINPTLLSATYTASLIAPNGSGMLTTSTIPQATVNATLSGMAHLALNASLGASGANASKFPSFSTVFTVDWSFPTFTLNTTSGLSIQNFGQEPEVGFHHVSLDLGSAINGMIGPVINDLYQVLKPVKPIVDFINDPMPLFNDVGVLKDLVGTNAQGVVTVGTFFEFLARADGGQETPEAEAVVSFANYVGQLYSLHDALASLSGAPADFCSGTSASAAPPATFLGISAIHRPSITSISPMSPARPALKISSTA